MCAWLTQELTQITREYTTPLSPQGFKAKKRRGSSSSSTSGRGVVLIGSFSHNTTITKMIRRTTFTKMMRRTRIWKFLATSVNLILYNTQHEDNNDDEEDDSNKDEEEDESMEVFGCGG